MSTAEKPLRADAERNRRRILETATQVIAEQGVDVCVDELARAAGVGMGTLYRRFPTKDDLLAAILEEQGAQLEQAIAAAAAAHEDPWASFRAAVTAYAAFMVGNRAFWEAVYERMARLETMYVVRDRLYDALRPALVRAQTAGVVRPDVEVVDIPPLLNGLGRIVNVRPELPRVWERYLGVLLDGLRAEGATALPQPAPAPLKRC